jgi:hypothetical protein
MHATIRLQVATMLIAGALVGCATGPSPAPATPVVSPSPSGATPGIQRDHGGDVTVEARWGGPAARATFELTLDTHSVDLDPLDLSDATLRNDRGDTLAAEPWAAPMGGHHRDGVLSFQGDAATFFAGARWIELVLVGVGDVPERVLRWELTT